MKNKTFLWQTNRCHQASTQRNTTFGFFVFPVRRNMIPERNMNVHVGAKIFVTKVGRYVNRDKRSKLLAVLGRGNLMMWIILYDVADACCKSRVIIQTVGLHT